MAETADQRKRVMFRFDADEHPNLDRWLDTQDNKSQSIVYALEKLIAQLGPDQDIIKQTLKEATVIQLDPSGKNTYLNPTDAAESSKPDRNEGDDA